MDLGYWFMLPVSVAVATVAMASGVEGATFFTPIFLLGLGLPVEVAVGTGLLTEVFGFASGLYAYTRRRLIDFRLGGHLLVATVPMAILGTVLSHRAEPAVLKIILAMGLVAVALSFLRTPEHATVVALDRAAREPLTGKRLLISAAGEEFRYTVCNRAEGGAIAGVGALFMGLISTGLGELNAFFLLQRCRVPSKISVATSVFVVAVTALTAASGHMLRFVTAGGDELSTVLSLATFTVPGVILGGQIGPYVASRIPERQLQLAMAVLFFGVALLLGWDVLA